VFEAARLVGVELHGGHQELADPVVCGRLDRRADRFTFIYGRSCLDRSDAVPVSEPELPLDDYEHEPLDGPMPRCRDDAAPDSWGRATTNAKLGAVGAELDPLVSLLESGSERSGALAIVTLVETNAEHPIRAKQVQRQPASKSRRGRKIPDPRIAAAAEAHRLTVLHHDSDFDLISNLTGRHCRWVVPAGTSD
jgi:hypothetical protein